MEYVEGEAAGSRVGMHVHGGRTQWPDLMQTHGCIRMSDKDIINFKNAIDRLAEQDSSDKPTTLTVTDDLKKPVTFSGDRERLLIVGSVALKEVTVVGKKPPIKIQLIKMPEPSVPTPEIIQ